MIWVILTVQHDGVLAVTQQMTRLTELGTSPTTGSSINVFGEVQASDARPRPPGLPAFAGVNAPGRPPPPAAPQPEHAVSAGEGDRCGQKRRGDSGSGGSPSRRCLGFILWMRSDMLTEI